MSLLLQTLAMILWKPNPKAFPNLMPTEPYEIAGAVISPTDLLILSLTAILLVALVWLVNYTSLGRAMRATAENPRVAGLMGVKPDVVISATFVIGAVLAAIAGIMLAHEIRHGAACDGLSCRGSRPSPRRCSAASATWPARWWAGCCSG
jgi:branched-chain amino acid transport system permease protein